MVAGEERRRREGLTATERQNTQGWLHVSEPYLLSDVVDQFDT